MWLDEGMANTATTTTNPRPGHRVTITAGQYRNEGGIVFRCYSAGPAARQKTIDVKIDTPKHHGETVHVKLSSVEAI